MNQPLPDNITRNQPRSKGQKRGGSVNRSYRIARVLHIYTSMLMLCIMLFFTVTGITLNHRDWLPDAPGAEISELTLPEAMQHMDLWQSQPFAQAENVRQWLSAEHGLLGNQVSFDWQPDEQLLVIDVKRPGGYSLAEVEPEAGLVVLEHQAYGITAILNDLHMGRYSGELWQAFIDLSALLMLVFTLTGFWLVLPQKKRRHRLLVCAGVGTGVMGLGYLWVLLA